MILCERIVLYSLNRSILLRNLSQCTVIVMLDFIMVLFRLLIPSNCLRGYAGSFKIPFIVVLMMLHFFPLLSTNIVCFAIDSSYVPVVLPVDDDGDRAGGGNNSDGVDGGGSSLSLIFFLTILTNWRIRCLVY